MKVGTILKTLAKQNPETDVLVAALKNEDNKYYVYEIEKLNVGSRKSKKGKEIIAIMARPQKNE